MITELEPPTQTIKVLKHESPTEKLLQQIEKILADNRMNIYITGTGLSLDHKGSVFAIRDIENRDATVSLPRSVESEKLVLLDT